MRIIDLLSEMYPDDYDTFRLLCMITVIAKRCGKKQTSQNAEWLAGTILETMLKGMQKTGQ